MKQGLSETFARKHFLLLVAFSIALCLLLVGCGSSQTAQIGNPMEFFEQARAGITNSDSFRMTGKMLMNYSDSSGSKDYRINYDMILQKRDTGFVIKMMMEGPTDPSVPAGSSGQLIETYITEDKMYVRAPTTGQWYYKDYNLGVDLTSIDQGFSPTSILEMLDSAKTVEVVEDTSSYTKYYLVLDPDKLMSDADLDASLEILKDNGGISIDMDQYKQMMRDFTSNMQIYLTVDKKSGYPTEFDMIIDKDIMQYIRNFMDQSGLPQGAMMTMSMNIEISDYGKPFDLSLPQEALEAKPLEELNQGNSF